MLVIITAFVLFRLSEDVMHKAALSGTSSNPRLIWDLAQVESGH